MILTSTSDCVYSTELNQLYCKAISNHSGEEVLTARLNTTFTRFNTGHFFAKKTQNVTILVNGWYD